MAHQPLKGQTALVTGASSGIGLGVAKALGTAGADGAVMLASASSGPHPARRPPPSLHSPPPPRAAPR